jgi:hypothetical protein
MGAMAFRPSSGGSQKVRKRETKWWNRCGCKESRYVEAMVLKTDPVFYPFILRTKSGKRENTLNSLRQFTDKGERQKRGHLPYR